MISSTVSRLSKLGFSGFNSRGRGDGGRPGDTLHLDQATAPLSLTFHTPGQGMYNASSHVYASFLSTLH